MGWHVAVIIPSSLRKKFSDHTWDFVYSYCPEAVTFRLSDADGKVLYLKLTVADAWPSLEMEADRMRWSAAYLPVPPVVDSGSDGEAHWLVTEALRGLPGTHSSFGADKGLLVRTLAAGLRAFHDLPVGECPFDFRLNAALLLTRDRMDAGLIDAERDFHPEFTHLTPADALSRLELEQPTSEDLVVCHGDYCLPNMLIDQDQVVGYVDLGELGVADRWWDLAVATWSLTWNLGGGYETAFLEAYGIQPDEERMEYYRLLYDMVS
jgi:kanamycin kinase